MKKKLLILSLGAMFGVLNMVGQTYVNEMLKSQVEADCYLDGGVAYNDAGDTFYEDNTYVQKASTDSPTAFTFNMDLVGNKNLTGFRVNMFLRMEDKVENWVKIEYSVDELNYLPVPDMKVEFSFDEAIGKGYWADVYFQGSLPAKVKEIKVTLLAKPGEANWVPCYRRTEIFYAGGSPYTYFTPPYLVKEAEAFRVDFETADTYLVDMAGSGNATSSIEVVANPQKDAVNSSDNVLKLVQAPGEPWGWGNGDWFGSTIALKTASGKQMTKITEGNKYLHISIYRADDTKIAMETWGGTATLKQKYDFVAKTGWADFVIDLTDNVGENFNEFFYSPNALFQTNGVQTAQTSYIDNIYLSNSPLTGIGANSVDNLTLISKKGGIEAVNLEGETIEIYNLSGLLLVKQQVQSQSQLFPLTKGLYIIKVGNTKAKAFAF